LIAAKFVKPYRKSNKNDYRDAEAICRSGQPHKVLRTPVRRRLNQRRAVMQPKIFVVICATTLYIADFLDF
jgi:hypothetical protein